ncbi:autotransporter outer membrane beta-barrel domain-containing protein [Flavobacterium tructae]|uniref:TMF family protein n=1 Tax=Flavobacterium tructae TaxID=1114873 RepID=A0A1S1J9J7_9FLAO|nr:hypothetical protein [Flavobacterium tructae]OHT44973.1 hypothetical protein BHE19_09665 [Flavobacterium tructae]OXB16676.1 hypothetical protein B0A71_19635 [Flavobacterium tructae]
MKKKNVAYLILLVGAISMNAQVVKGTQGSNGPIGGGNNSPGLYIGAGGGAAVNANATTTNLNVGIGTNNPSESLDVNGNIRGNIFKAASITASGAITSGGTIQGNSITVTGDVNANRGFFTGNVGIGTSNPSNVQGWSRVLDVAGADNSKILATVDNSTYKTGIFSHSSWFGGGGFIGTESNHALFLIAGYDPKVAILPNGNVGIGSKNPDAKLTVNGDIHATEVRINTNIPVPDYVFLNDYRLRTLQEVEDYIKKNSHLPEIPSAKEIEKDGLLLAEMNLHLLKKIEEVTLYLIQQNKEMEALKAEVKALAVQKDNRN